MNRKIKNGVHKLTLAALWAVLLLSHFANADIEPMIFTQEWSGGNDENAAWVQATGRIEHDTVERFRDFMKGNELRVRVVFDSPGGSLLGALELGQAIRDLGYTTAVGQTKKSPGEPYGAIAGGECYSACVFAFMGGVHRELDEEDQIGVHQHYRNDALADQTTVSFTGLDMSRIQLIDGVLVSYTRHMGVDPYLVALAASVGPDEPIAILDHQLLAELRFATNLWQPGQWTLIPNSEYLIGKLRQPQDDQPITVEVEFFCEETVTGTHHGMIMNIPFDGDPTELASDLNTRGMPMELRFGLPSRLAAHDYSYFHKGAVSREIERPIYSKRSWPDKNDTLSVILLLSATDVEQLRQHQSLWVSPAANYLNHRLSHQFSLDNFDVVAPYVLSHCIH